MDSPEGIRVKGKNVTGTFFLTVVRVNEVTVNKFLGLFNIKDFTINI
jgi:hypothetical protein